MTGGCVLKLDGIIYETSPELARAIYRYKTKQRKLNDSNYATLLAERSRADEEIRTLKTKLLKYEEQ